MGFSILNISSRFFKKQKNCIQVSQSSFRGLVSIEDVYEASQASLRKKKKTHPSRFLGAWKT